MNNLEKVKILEFNQKGDSRGHLVVAEGGKDIPFNIERVFYIYGTDKNTIRGQHANKETEFVLINVAGTSKVKVDDGFGNKKIINLDRPHIGVYIPTLIWKDMYDFSPDSVLLVMASRHYNPDEYIRDYDKFVTFINSNYEN